MKQIPSTLYLFLKQEWITLGVYVLATLLFFSIIFAGGNQSSGISFSIADASQIKISEHQLIALLLNAMLSVFMGLYLGSGFLRLRQSHLWNFLPSYKLTLIISFVLAALLYAVVQSIAMRYAGWGLFTALLATASITLLTAQAIIGNQLIMKVLLPISPFILFQLTRIEISIWIILILVVSLAILALYLNYHSKNNTKEPTFALISGNTVQQNKSLHFQKVNQWIGDFFLKLGIKNSSDNLAVALMRPNNRFGITSLIGTIGALLFFHQLDGSNLEVEGIAALMMISVLTGIFMELKLLARQCKPFAHLYSGNHYWEFKKRVVTTLQKHMLMQAFIYWVILMLLSFLISDFLEPLLVSRYILAVTLIALILIPAFLCLNWYSVNFSLIGVVGLFVLLSVTLCGWLYDYESPELMLMQMTATLILVFLLQKFAKTWWKKQAIEVFFKAYG